jgi:hypothetical protein
MQETAFSPRLSELPSAHFRDDLLFHVFVLEQEQLVDGLPDLVGVVGQTRHAVVPLDLFEGVPHLGMLFRISRLLRSLGDHVDRVIAQGREEIEGRNAVLGLEGLDELLNDRVRVVLRVGCHAERPVRRLAGDILE